MFLYEASPEKPTFAPDFKGAVAGDNEKRSAAEGLWNATRDFGLNVNNANAQDGATAEAYERRNKQIFEATGVQLENPYRQLPAFDNVPFLPVFGKTRDYRGEAEAKWNDRVKQLARERPEHAGVIRPDKPISDDAFAIARESEAGFAAASQRADQAGVGPLAKLGATLGGGTVAMLRDPLQVNTMVYGGGIAGPAKTVVWKIAQTMFTEAVINAGVEAGVQLASEDWKKQAGVEHGLAPALKQVGIAALFGGAFGGLLEGGAAAFRALGRDVPTEALTRTAAGEPAPGDIGTLATALGVELDPQVARTVELAADQSDLDRAAFGEPPAGVSAAEADSLAADAVRLAEDPVDAPIGRDLADRHDTIERIVGREMPVGGVPKKPVSLFQFLAARSVGGLVDDNGALAAMGLSKKFIPGSGPLVRKGGKSLDYAREAAAEAGYFDDLYGHPDLATQRSTVDDLLRKLQAEAAGEPAYSPRNDNGRIYDWQDYESRVRAQNAFRRIVEDVDGAIDELGIDHSIDDTIIANAARYVDDETDAAAALERALDEDYRSFADALSERGEDPIDESDIPFFEDTAASADAGRAAGDAGSDGGPAGRGAAEADSGQLSRAGGNQAAATAESLKPGGDLPEPGTTEAADVAGLALTEARRGSTGSPQAEPLAIERPADFTVDVWKAPVAEAVKAVRELARRLFAGKTVTNAADGSEIMIPWTGIKHALSGNVSRPALAATLKLDDLIVSGRPAGRVADKAGRLDVKAIHYYDRTIAMEGKTAEIRVVVREASDGKRYYDHFEVRGGGDGSGPKTQPDGPSLREGRESSPPAGNIGQNAASEKTAAGEQTLLGGVAPVSTKEKLDAQGAKPLKGGGSAGSPQAAMPEGGLFDLESRKQLDIWDAMPAAKNADGTVLHATHETMLADAERSEFYSGIIASCKE